MLVPSPCNPLSRPVNKAVFPKEPPSVAWRALIEWFRTTYSGKPFVSVRENLDRLNRQKGENPQTFLAELDEYVNTIKSLDGAMTETDVGEIFILS